MCMMMIESERLSMLGLLARVSRPTSRMFLAPVTEACLRAVVVCTVPSRFCWLTALVAVFSNTWVATTEPVAATTSTEPRAMHQRAHEGERRLLVVLGTLLPVGGW